MACARRTTRRSGIPVDAATRILVPVAGRGGYDRIRSRVPGSLRGSREREVDFPRILPSAASDAPCRGALRDLAGLAVDSVPEGGNARVARGDDVAGTLALQARDRDLMILGLIRQGRRDKGIGAIARGVAAEARWPLLLIRTPGCPRDGF